MSESERERDARLVAPLDFPVLCDITVCEQQATQGVRCRKCGQLVYLLCGAHAGWLERNRADQRVTSTCGAWGAARDVLEYRPISEWSR